MRNSHWYRGAVLAATVIAGCAEGAGRDGAELAGAAQGLSVCPFLASGWNTHLQGTPGSNLDEAAYGAAVDEGACAIYHAGYIASDGYVTKYSTTGALAWTQTISTTASDTAQAVAIDSEHNVYVAGCTGGRLAGSPQANAGGDDAFLEKFDRDGSLQWVRQLGSAGNDCAYGVAVSPSDEVYIAGTARGALPGGGTPPDGNADAFLAKYSSGGTLQFSRLVGTDGDDEALAVAVGSEGNIYITGYTTGNLVPGGWQGGEDIFLDKFDATGTSLWLRQRGTPLDERAYGIAVNAFDEVFLTGSTRGSLDGNAAQGGDDIVVLSYTTAGAWRWTDQRGSAVAEQGLAIAVDGDGVPYITGYADAALGGQAFVGIRDGILMKYTRTGGRTWTREFGVPGATGTTTGTGIAIGFDSEFVVGGTLGDLNGEINQGGNDRFAVRYNSAGTVW
jgi:hypothetical protein